MEATSTSAPAAGTSAATTAATAAAVAEVRKESNTVYWVLGIGIIILLAIGAWYMVSPTKTIAAAKPNNPNDPLNAKIPGVTPGATATGILTDKNFFAGLSNLATNIYGMVESAKKGGGSGSGGNNYTPPGPANYPQTYEESQTPMIYAPNNNLTEDQKSANAHIGLA